MVQIHANATTTPKVRAEIQASNLSNAALARRYGVTVETIKRWRGRDSVEDRSHTPHRLRTTLTEAQEVLAVELRRTLLLPLDDLLTVVQELINPAASRSGLDRLLRRKGVSNLDRLKAELTEREGPEAVERKAFKVYDPGFIHIDIKYLPLLPGDKRRRYLFVAIDRATRWVYVEIRKNKSARSARGFLQRLIRACPVRIQKILTDNGKEFTDRFAATGKRQPTGKHPFDQVCAEHGIEHRLTPPRRPQTNGMVERFNGRISDVLRTHHFDSSEDLEATLRRYVHLYNHHIPQRALGHRTPIDTLKAWQIERPDLFVKQVYNHPGPDNCPCSRPRGKR